jgi:hypothetical protein
LEVEALISIEKETRLNPSQVLEKAVAYFGPEGMDLKVSEQAECCARFEGGGGYVFIQASPRVKGKGSKVEIEGREWERELQKFLDRI